jgi:4-hydroxy-L-threonine phosphate dehydrogenase PdxA
MKSIALTPGAEDGVGPELLLRAIKLNPLNVNYFWCGDKASLERASIDAETSIDFIDETRAFMGKKNITFMPDIKEDCLLKRQAQFLKKSVELASNDLVSAIVTGPIEKAALSHLPQKFAGQTEYFAHFLGKDKKPFMAFLGGPFMLSLLTSHMPLAKVSSVIKKESVIEHILAVARHQSLMSGSKLSEVKVALLGLNPHAGELGLLGHEEEEILKPAVKELSSSLNISGPWPADGFFAYFHEMKKEDLPQVVVASYHDQGLIPYKLLAKGHAVNITLGLKIPRTSPAHGTAKDLRGKNPCPLSTINALKVACELA